MGLLITDGTVVHLLQDSHTLDHELQETLKVERVKLVRQWVSPVTQPLVDSTEPQWEPSLLLEDKDDESEKVVLRPGQTKDDSVHKPKVVKTLRRTSILRSSCAIGPIWVSTDE